MVIHAGEGCQFRFKETVKITIDDDGYALVPEVAEAVGQIHKFIQHYLESPARLEEALRGEVDFPDDHI